MVSLFVFLNYPLVDLDRAEIFFCVFEYFQRQIKLK